MNMKTKIKLLIAIFITLIASVFIIPSVFAADLEFNYSNKQPPFDHNGHTVYCREYGKALSGSYGTLYYNTIGDRTNITTKQALALTDPEALANGRVRQIIVWKYIANVGNTLSTDVTNSSEYAKAVEIINKAENATIHNKNDFKVNKTKPKLVDISDGKAIVGPYSIDYKKSDYSKIEDVYLTNANGAKISVSGIKFENGYVSTKVSDIDANEKFYLIFDISKLGNSNTIKMNFKYSYTNASGSKISYQSVGSSNGVVPGNIQKLIGITAKREPGTRDVPSDETVEITMDLGGRVFLDVLMGKNKEVNGIYNNDGNVGNPENDRDLEEAVKVILYEKGTNKKVAEITTKNTYKFKNVNVTKEYYVVFEYNGIKLMPTTYQTLKYNNEVTALKDRSYGSELKAERIAFNNRFAEITANTDTSNPIMKAYADMNLEGKTTYYKIGNTEERLLNINLGLMYRPEFDMAVRKDLYDINMNINDITHNYVYNARTATEDPVLEIRGSDLPTYERDVRREDLTYAGDKKLEILLTYKIDITNQSQGYIKGEATNLIEYFDKDYTYVNSYYMEGANNRKELSWTTPEVSGDYMKMTTSSLRGVSLSNDQTLSMYITFKVNESALAELLEIGSDIKENYIEIGGYKTNYIKTAKDLNGNVIYSEGEVAGLTDIDSKPGNFNPSDNKIKEFVKWTRTSEYQNKTQQEKQAESRKFFEDDADMAPGIRLKVLNEPRTLSGNIWEDEALAAKLNENLKLGNGSRDQEEKLINGVKIQLINEDNGEIVKETKTNTDGWYEFREIIPGRYNIKFIYGTEDTLNADMNNGKVYAGHDYKSTIFDETKHDENTYWYTDDNSLSDAKDNWGRREEVNAYSKDLTNYKSEILNNKTNKEELEKLKMFAQTPKMVLEMEYARTKTNIGDSTDYSIQKVDFGIIERPISELEITKKVSHMKITTSDGQTLFDSSETTQNLAWTEEQIQAIIDNNLIHGSKLEVTYGFEIENIGQRDYADPEFYYYGNINESKIVKTKANEVIDYVYNNLDFDRNLPGNEVWDVVEVSAIQSEGEDTLVNKEIDLTARQVIIKANSSNNLVAKELAPGEKTQTDNVLLTRTLSDGNGEDLLVYDNITEIVKTYNTVGRRLETSILGNLDPEAPVFDEPNQAEAQQLMVLPPFGSINIAYYVLGLVSLGAVLAGGIFLINKKVLKNKE